MNNTGTNTINRNYLHKVWMVMTCVYALSMHTMTAQISQSSENDTHKKSWGIHLSLPHINHFHLKPPIEQVRKTNTGFWGVAMGVDYFYSSHSYFTLSGSGNMDFFIPVPASPSIEGKFELMSSVYGSLMHSSVWKRFTWGYGVTYGRNVWSFRNADDITGTQMREPVSESYATLGVQTQILYEFKKKIYVGLIYRPTFIRIQASNQYEHLISMTIGKRINKN
ncbi:MAG: hypothetical protein AAFO96_27135 [Bacteroidota bacterium]